MADLSAQINGEVKSPELRPEFSHLKFVENVYRDWIKSNDPDGVLVCKDTENVSISSNSSLFQRVSSSNVIFSWNFKITTCGKRLQRVVLTMDQNRNNFILASVCKDNIQIGTMSTQEWLNTDLEIDKSNGAKSNKVQYNIKICFTTNEYGTYRQNIMFYFGEYPVILKRLCADCLPVKDYLRIYNAAEYQLSQAPKMWVDETMQVTKFQSPFVTPKDPNEAKLSMVYPYPDRNTFPLSQETLTDSCLTPKNYRGRFHELISVEELARHEQVARYNEVCSMHLFSHYILASTGDASTIAKYAPPGELFAQLSLSRSISEDTKSGRLFLRGCNTVIFMKFPPSDPESPALFEAHIEDKCTSNVYIRLSKECVDKLNLTANTHVTVQVQFVLNRLPFCEWHRAVDCLPDVNLVFLRKIHRKLQTDIMLEFLSNKDTIDWNRDWISSIPLNEDQKRALTVMTITTNISLPPVLVLGPFGTGKTFTIAQALRILLLQSPKHKILLCTHSNSAADLYVKEFFDVWYKLEKAPALKPVRVYYKGRARNTVHPVVQEYSLMNENGTFRDPVEEDLRGCGLIVTTLATSSSLTCLNLSLTHIVIDEAAQALECEVLVPLTLATSNTRLILAGDHMQLAPEIFSDLANERGLGISLLERVYGLYPPAHACKIHLCQNYRAHADIMKFTSEMFYDGMVQPGTSKLPRHPILKPLTFYCVLGEEVLGVHSTGYAHPTEAYELANRVSELKNTWPVTLWGPYGEGSIGVLSYYADQVQRIRVELRNRKLFDVSVERVLNVQGKQFTAVFISTVRTRACCRYSAEKNVKDYGFLTNPRLLNTAITRAKCLVAVVGDPIALLTIGSCRKLWQKYMEVADLHGMDRETLRYHVSLAPELPLATPLNPLAQEFVPRNPQSSCLVEYMPLPMMYSVVHYSPSFWSLR